MDRQPPETVNIQLKYTYEIVFNIFDYFYIKNMQ